MSAIGNLFGKLFGKKETDAAALPYANCSTTCPAYPDGCEVCGPYKKKLLDLVWDADHLEEYYARYEIVPNAETAGTAPCPYCGGANRVGANFCEYCGSQLRKDSGKIRVTDAKEIPSPLLAAQDLIFERAYIMEELEKKKGSGLLESISELVGGKSESLGDKMTEDEIKTTAAAYGVSVGTYLQGLDNGKYLTASKKAEEDKKAEAAASLGSVGTSASAGAPGFGASHAFRPRPKPTGHGSRPLTSPPSRPPMGHGGNGRQPGAGMKPNGGVHRAGKPLGGTKGGTAVKGHGVPGIGIGGGKRPGGGRGPGGGSRGGRR
ncbi:MAG: zinc ribbon domain-containing protein [Lachnospiraceae bacterium]|nr:zinc ribbon domain-containing protein [Lachnospiraceae bacterium]